MERILFILNRFRYPLHTELIPGTHFPAEMDWGIHVLKTDPQLSLTCWEITQFAYNNFWIRAFARKRRSQSPWGNFNRKLAAAIDCNQRHFDVIVSFSNSASGTLLRMKAEKALRPKLICSAIGASDAVSQRGSNDILSTRMLRLADLSIVLDEKEKAFLERSLNLKVWKACFGVDCLYWNDILGLGTPPRSRYVLSAGRDPLRDWETLMRSCSHPLKIVAPDHQRPPRTAQNIIFWGEVDIEEYRALVAASNLVVVPTRDSLRASGMNVTFQAMAMGKCVITSRTKSEWWKDADELRALVSVEVGNESELRKTINELWDNETLRTQVASNGREYVAKYATSTDFVKSLKDAIVSVL